MFHTAKATLLQFPGGLGGSYRIPNSVTSIGQSAFEASYITTVTIPNSVTNIGQDAFANCTILTNINVDAANPAYSSMNGVLFDKAQATLLQFPGDLGGGYTIPNSVTSIGGGNSFFGGAFGDCASLTSVTIPNSVTSIGDYAFESCSSLTSVTIGNSVTSIGDGAFYDCTSLTGIYFQGNSPTPTTDSTVFSGDPATVYYLPSTTGWGAMFDGLPTAPWFLANPQILNNGDILIQFSGGVPGALYDVEESSDLLTWTVAATDPANAMGSFSFEDTATAGVPMRFYRAVRAYSVGGTLTGLPYGETVTLQDIGADNLTLSANGTFTFPTALPNGHAYSVTVSGTSGINPIACTITNGSGTISGTNVTNILVQCTFTGRMP